MSQPSNGRQSMVPALSRASGYSVLIVEDDGIIALDIQQSLQEIGYDAYAIAASGEEAIRVAAARCPDAVLMDIRLRGDMDGISAATVLKKKFGLPVIFLTAHSDDATLARARQAEPHGYLLKPVKMAELKSAIEVSVYKNTMERRLRERERWFGTTLESIADAVISVDLSGRVAFMNPVAENLTGIKAVDALGRPAREVLKLETREPGDAVDDHPLERALRDRQTVAIAEATIRRPDQSTRLIDDSAAPVFDEGRLLGAVMVFRDVTEQTRLRHQAELASRLASLGTMAAGVGHEINNPLAVVVANVAFLAEGLRELAAHLADGESLEHPRRILAELLDSQGDTHAAAGRIAKIVAALREFARQEDRPGQADVARSVKWAVRMTEHELRHRALLAVEVGDLPPVGLDEVKLGQILVNLIVNAAHAITPGNPTGNRVVVHAGVNDQGQVLISVRDTGAGIAADVLPRIFDPFFTTKEVGDGTGLGLSIVHGIVSAAGGILDVESEVGHGTAFQITLPVAAPRTSPDADAPSADVARAEAAVTGRVLIVDDEPLVVQVVARVLAAHDIVRATSGEEALRLVREGGRYDLIITDVAMGKLSGMTLYEELLRTHPDDAHRMVFLTGGALTAEVDAFLLTVSNTRIMKPFNPDELRRIVGHRIVLARSDGAGHPPADRS